MSNFYKVLSVLILVILFGCSKDDDTPAQMGSEEEDLYSNALVSAKPEQLSGVWSIYEITYQSITAEVPASFEECGRDFFQFFGENTYRETLFTSDYECQKQVQDLKWELKEGIISLSNVAGSTMEMVIVELDANKLIFKSEADIDEDGETEILYFTARHYSPPNDPDLYSYTFHSIPIENSQDKIAFQWDAYDGFYNFDRYEIYRSKNECSKFSAELLASIDDVSVNTFIDENPPAQEKICYFFRIYNEKGLLGESEIYTLRTEFLIPAGVGFSEVKVLDGKIELNWQPYTGNYFSHYEISVRNYKEGSGSGYQEELVATIEDREVGTYLDEDPPILIDPVYAIYAYDIFGNKSVRSTSGENAWTVKWEHPEVLKVDYIRFMAIDQEETYIYLYVIDSEKGGFQLIKYDYQHKQVVAEAKELPRASTNVEMQVYRTANGMELFFAQGSGLSVYDAKDMRFKYSLKPSGMLGFSDYAYLGDNRWVFTDGQGVATYERQEASLNKIEEKDHFPTHHGSGRHQIITLKDRQFLLGHELESQSLLFSVAADGSLSEGELVNVPIRSLWKKDTYYSPEQDYLLDAIDKRLYSTQTFSLQTSFEKPYYPTGISRDGSLIFGSYNDPEWWIDNESLHEKKASIYNVKTGQVETYDTRGYPLVLFENHQGQLMSISSGFKRQSIERSSPTPDLFVEVVKM